MVEAPHDFRILNVHETGIEPVRIHEDIAFPRLGSHCCGLFPLLGVEIVPGREALCHLLVYEHLGRPDIAVKKRKGSIDVLLDVLAYDAESVPSLP